MVYVFALEFGTWRETQRIVPSNPINEGHLGNSLSVQGDTLAVGAWLDSHAERGVHSPRDIPEAAGGGGGELVDRSGAAYVFRKRDGRWEEERYFKAFNRAANALFGETVALEGDLLFVGAPWESGAHGTADADEIASGAIEADPATLSKSGAVYVYERGEDDWTPKAYLKAFEPSADSLFWHFRGGPFRKSPHRRPMGVACGWRSGHGQGRCGLSLRTRRQLLRAGRALSPSHAVSRTQSRATRLRLATAMR